MPGLIDVLSLEGLPLCEGQQRKNGSWEEGSECGGAVSVEGLWGEEWGKTVGILALQGWITTVCFLCGFQGLNSWCPARAGGAFSCCFILLSMGQHPIYNYYFLRWFSDTRMVQLWSWLAPGYIGACVTWIVMLFQDTCLYSSCCHRVILVLWCLVRCQLDPGYSHLTERNLYWENSFHSIRLLESP